MKIKVVDMTYEQALAQPPQVHKKPKKPSLLFRTVLRAASAPDLLATHFHCEKIGMAQIKSDEPCLVLMNHSEMESSRNARLRLTGAGRTSWPAPSSVARFHSG